ncbi:V-type proton ATPase 116 kDa subunit a 1-like [Toxorhynchites rutilus septentrionalis]|uniref:V-type proton ATPase 116 kDa subunit a 1-like n=1 Tax=Toxorhynchites rutilus septentrionalis TaxID=329112 RepID=UPI00247A3FC3|nr:V-type proton ATPase 116 kDa subunit a 1-like [Toxorhynchites rutilus septentrionalis]
MGAMFRSEQMDLVQLLIQPEAAYQSIAELGELGIAQFRDLNADINVFQRKYTSEIRRCEEMERKIFYIRRELSKDEVATLDITDNIPRTPNSREIIDLEAALEKTENEILELSENSHALLQNFMELTELKCVLEKTQGFFADKSAAQNLGATGGDPGNENKPLGFVAGVIPRERIIGFERMLWRVSRGNVFLRQVAVDKPFTDPRTGDAIYKIVFVAFFQGEQLKTRVKKICSGYHASLYPCPSEYTEREEMLQGVRTRIEDLNMVINQTKDQRQRVLISVARELPKWEIIVKKIKAIYHTMNMFSVDVSKKCLFGEAWVPTDDLQHVKNALIHGSSAVGSTVPSFLNVISTSETPPTYNRTNKFTQGFQNLIESYGVASYREANPALYTIITFPFLFAIMFGDLGHGLLLTLLGVWMVGWEKSLDKNKDEIWQLFFGGRYIILLMGCFSMYTGFVYNDVFSKPMNLFGSSWIVNYNTSTIMENKDLQMNPSEDYSETVYWYGLDPVWMLASNKIIFLNSFKMKLSIIFGVVHMIFGVCMSVVNSVHFRKPMNILLDFVPQLLFLVLLFAYMCFMMFFKWVHYTAVTEIDSLKPGCAPSVLILFINMMLFGEQEPLEGCEEFMFEGQKTLQTVFIFIALICIPWLLLAKPFYIMATRKKNTGSDHVASAGHGDHDDEPLSEIFIHQAIHCIEYVLSTISHTASYLRLWALSLAHAQLSEVLYSMVLFIGLKSEGYMGGLMIYLMFWPWAILTIGILVGMEGLSAFLHTLRLHWVEFMSKFYEGLGHPFQPFSFKKMLEAEREEK